MPPAAWWIAALLPPGCGMKPTIRVFGHYGLPRLIESSAAGSVDSLGNPFPHSSYALLDLPCRLLLRISAIYFVKQSNREATPHRQSQSPSLGSTKTRFLWPSREGLIFPT